MNFKVTVSHKDKGVEKIFINAKSMKDATHQLFEQFDAKTHGEFNCAQGNDLVFLWEPADKKQTITKIIVQADTSDPECVIKCGTCNEIMDFKYERFLLPCGSTIICGKCAAKEHFDQEPYVRPISEYKNKRWLRANSQLTDKTPKYFRLQHLCEEHSSSMHVQNSWIVQADNIRDAFFKTCYSYSDISIDGCGLDPDDKKILLTQEYFHNDLVHYEIPLSLLEIVNGMDMTVWDDLAGHIIIDEVDYETERAALDKFMENMTPEKWLTLRFNATQCDHFAGCDYSVEKLVHFTCDDE